MHNKGLVAQTNSISNVMVIEFFLQDISKYYTFIEVLNLYFSSIDQSPMRLDILVL